MSADIDTLIAGLPNLKARFEELEKKSTLTEEEWREAEVVKMAFEILNDPMKVGQRTAETVQADVWIPRINLQFQAWRAAQQRVTTFR